MLSRLAELDQIVRAGYQASTSSACSTLCSISASTILSAFYFDMRKDALYCDPHDSVTRRSALTVLDSVFGALTAWLAPMLAFTMEEAWWNRFPGEASSVHARQFPTIPAAWRDEALAEKWRKVRAVRRVVTGALEIERKEGRIGSSLEAAPKVYVADRDLREALAGVDLAEISITSDAELMSGVGPEGAFRLDDVSGLAVVFAPRHGMHPLHRRFLRTSAPIPNFPSCRCATPRRSVSSTPAIRWPRNRSRMRYLWGPLSPLGLGVASVTLILDQAHEAWMLYVYDIGAKGTVRVARFSISFSSGTRA